MSSPTDEITELLRRWSAGDDSAAQQLFPLVYRELHRMAKRYMTQGGPGHTLQTTAVIHEAYLKLAGGERDWENRAHFFGVAAKAMRHILLDHARTNLAVKRGAEVQFVPLDEAVAFVFLTFHDSSR